MSSTWKWSRCAGHPQKPPFWPLIWLCSLIFQSFRRRHWMPPPIRTAWICIPSDKGLIDHMYTPTDIYHVYNIFWYLVTIHPSLCRVSSSLSCVRYWGCSRGGEAVARLPGATAQWQAPVVASIQGTGGELGSICTIEVTFQCHQTFSFLYHHLLSPHILNGG